MITSYLNGLFISCGLIIAIGAQNAFVLSQGLKRQYHLITATICAVCDAVLVSAGVFGLANLLLTSPNLLLITRIGGIIFLLTYGSLALKRTFNKESLQQNNAPPISLKQTIITTLAVTLLNPHVYLDTVLLVGALAAQQPSPFWYAIGAISASFGWFWGLAISAAKLSSILSKPITWKVVDILIAIMMFGIALQLILGLS